MEGEKLFKIKVPGENVKCASCNIAFGKREEAVHDEYAKKHYHRRCFNDNNIVGKRTPRPPDQTNRANDY